MFKTKETAVKSTDKIIENLYKEANEIEPENLTSFFEKVMTEYNWDYGSICSAINICIMATVKSIDKYSDQAGITGAQAGFIMWEFIRHFQNIKCPMKLIEYDKMLYPQYEQNFDKKINKSTFEWLQNEAKENLKQVQLEPSNLSNTSNIVVEHWKKIIDGVVPFGYTIR